MLIAVTPIHEQAEIECNQIKKFYNLTEANLYAKLKGYMVIKEHGQDMWLVMPKYDGVLVGGCFEEN